MKDFVYRWQIPVSLCILGVVYLIDHRVASDHGVTDTIGPVRKEVYETVATIFGALFGFVITAFSIVVSLGDSAVVRRLRESGDYGRVTQAFIKTTYIVGSSTLVAVVALFMDARSGSPSRAWEYAVLLASVAGGLAVLGIITVLEMLVDAQ